MQPLADADYVRFRNLIVSRTGLDFPFPRRQDLGSGLTRTLSQLHDIQRYQPHRIPAGTALPVDLGTLYETLIARDAFIWDVLVDALTICETHFFRNTPQFEALREQVLPDLIARQRSEGKLSLRLWSAGCASGEEAYSLAILLREMLPDWKEWRLDILGTDINGRAVSQARRGIYRDWSFREASAFHWRDLYFDKRDAEYGLHEDVREMVHFETCNLLENCLTMQNQTSYLDLILCRNVILYFGTHARQWIYQLLHRALVPGGWLLVGHADPPPPNFAAFDTHSFHGATFHQRPFKGALAPQPEPVPVEVDVEPESIPTQAPRIQEDSDAMTKYRLGLWHANRQHWEEALLNCQQAVELAPTFTQAHFTLALIYQSLGLDEQAMGSLRHTIYLERNWPLPHFTLASILRQIGQPDGARRELRNVLVLTARLSPDDPIEGAEGLTAARLHAVAERQMQSLPLADLSTEPAEL